MYTSGNNKPVKRRFEARQETIVKDLQRVMKNIGASSLKIEQDILSGAAKVIFDRAGKRYTRECKKYSHNMDNLRVIGLQIEYLYRALEVYAEDIEGSEFDIEFDRIFSGLFATPDDSALLLGDGVSLWWEILGIERDASPEAIRSAYRALARVHAPDAGGDEETMKKINVAYKSAMDEKRGK
jgi:hypothetical protein